MTHYHAAPLSGTNLDNVRFFAARHAMISFRTPDRVAIVADVAQSFLS